jgi:uncharacterized damage-inducible protein DinB
MNLAQSFCIQAAANRLANHRMAQALAALPAADFTAPRVGFFPSLHGTLNHILGVDCYYVGALHGETDGDLAWARFVPAATPAQWAERQAHSDARLLRWCQGLSEAACAAEVRLPRGQGRIQRDSAAAVLMHLFMHQHHHRGQAHAMLSGTGVAPPQLDEFMMPSEAHLRRADMAALGLDEQVVYGAPGANASPG